MSKADVIEVEGVVVEKLPNAFFKVAISLADFYSLRCLA